MEKYADDDDDGDGCPAMVRVLVRNGAELITIMCSILLRLNKVSNSRFQPFIRNRMRTNPKRMYAELMRNYGLGLGCGSGSIL